MNTCTTCTHTHVCMHTGMHARMHAGMHARMHAGMHACMHAHTCMDVHTHTHIHTHTCVHTQAQSAWLGSGVDLWSVSILLAGGTTNRAALCHTLSVFSKLKKLALGVPCCDKFCCATDQTAMEHLPININITLYTVCASATISSLIIDVK